MLLLVSFHRRGKLQERLNDLPKGNTELVRKQAKFEHGQHFPVRRGIDGDNRQDKTGRHRLHFPRASEAVGETRERETHWHSPPHYPPVGRAHVNPPTMGQAHINPFYTVQIPSVVA